MDTTLQLPKQTIEETDEYLIERDANGSTEKNWKHATSTPHRIDFLIKTRADWEEYKPRLQWSRDRVDWECTRRRQQEARQKGNWFHFHAAFGYDHIQGVVGSERLLVAMATEPEWVEDMFMTYGRLLLQ